ncbi:MAG: hypothetical protein ACM3ON_06355 [Chloroflexota bacterium]
MELLASLFVGKPQNILAVAVVLLAGYLVLRFTTLGGGRRPRLLLVAAVAWMVYAAWEWLVQIKTPEANIRVDLLVIWPVLAILSSWALFRSLRRHASSSTARKD